MFETSDPANEKELVHDTACGSECNDGIDNNTFECRERSRTQTFDLDCGRASVGTASGEEDSEQCVEARLSTMFEHNDLINNRLVMLTQEIRRGSLGAPRRMSCKLQDLCIEEEVTNTMGQEDVNRSDLEPSSRIHLPDAACPTSKDAPFDKHAFELGYRALETRVAELEQENATLRAQIDLLNAGGRDCAEVANDKVEVQNIIRTSISSLAAEASSDEEDPHPGRCSEHGTLANSPASCLKPSPLLSDTSTPQPASFDRQAKRVTLAAPRHSTLGGASGRQERRREIRARAWPSSERVRAMRASKSKAWPSMESLRDLKVSERCEPTSLDRCESLTEYLIDEIEKLRKSAVAGHPGSFADGTVGELRDAVGDFFAKMNPSKASSEPKPDDQEVGKVATNFF